MNTTGFYGKLPARGDFISGRVPATFKNTWDDWAQQLVTACKTIANENTSEVWHKLPVYRFYLSPGIAGDNAWVGVTLPSQDSVGRLFPFCIARDINANLQAPRAMNDHAEFFNEIESQITALFAGELEFDLLTQTLESLDQKIVVDDTSTSPLLSRQSEEPALSIKLSGGLSDNTWALASNAILGVTCSAHSIWTTSPLSNASEETLFCEFMPSAVCCENLFTGHFEPAHWTQYNDTQNKICRDGNKLAINAAAAVLIPEPREGDTQPVFKQPVAETPREADLLDLDDSDPPDAPWET